MRVLILEDQAADAELMATELRRHGFVLEWLRVDTEAAYTAALERPPEVILSDYSMPGFQAPRALEIVQARQLDIPFIVVTGSINEEVAVDCMKRGASDYLLKDRLVRLGPAVAAALGQARLRRERALAVEATRMSEERFRRYFELGLIGMAITSPAKRYMEVNDTICEILGYERQELLGKTWAELS
ncbi:MAG TPA: response regulator, partial [Thermoanaerobaculaceae bacterium]|nr:response regulator [Thermoanaerobaculaceae bacterium]